MKTCLKPHFSDKDLDSCEECFKLNNPEVVEKDREKESIKTEAAILWSMIAERLPRTVARESMGDEKIFRAFYEAFVSFRPSLLSRQREEMDREIDNLQELFTARKDVYTKGFTEDYVVGGVNALQELKEILAALLSRQDEKRALDRFYGLYEEGRRKEKAPIGYIEYFKAAKFLLDNLSLQVENVDRVVRNLRSNHSFHEYHGPCEDCARNRAIDSILASLKNQNK